MLHVPIPIEIAPTMLRYLFLIHVWLVQMVVLLRKRKTVVKWVLASKIYRLGVGTERVGW
jgi:hypothetical protein